MRVRVIRQMFQLHCMIEKLWPDFLTLSTTFYHLLVSRNLFSKAEIRQFGTSGTEGITFGAIAVWKNEFANNSKNLILVLPLLNHPGINKTHRPEL